MSDFIVFRDAVNRNFTNMSTSGEVFIADVDKDVLWDTYMGSFPDGTNPMFRERTEHDCSCCKNFIRHVGNVITINGNCTINTVWDISVGGTYQIIADSMAEVVRAASIRSIFRTSEKRYGLLNNTEMREDGSIHTWEHFVAEIPRNLVLTGSGVSVGQAIGDSQASLGVLKRSLEEITMDSIDTVHDLIAQNSLYRGQEHKATVDKLKKAKKSYDAIDTARGKELFLWSEVVKHGHAVRFKNTVIGTLLVDLSEDVDLEVAVKSFETKVAPTNYKRSSALITQGMIKKANDKIKELGLEDSLARRFAVESDLTINNVLFADRDTGLAADATALDVLKPTKTTKPRNLDKVQEMSIADFIANVLPSAESLELMVSNSHQNNFMSLIAPKVTDAPNILKWGNNFSWGYAGDMTDSIKDRVKSAGGSVDGDVRASASWFNGDDLDVSMNEPGGYKIYFGNKRQLSPNGGMLDVDMNAGGSHSRAPVENITYKNKARMRPGAYEVIMHNFCKRESKDVGFIVQIEVCGKVYDFHHTAALRDRQHVKVATINVAKDGEITVTPTEHVESSAQSKEVWGIHTEQFTKVKMAMLSPNHWDDNEVGNKHYFFILEGCENPEDARGLYNEFLRKELIEHRKVFEVLGSKLKVEHTPEQLSGVGFSTTKNDSVIVKVGGSFNRTLKINF